MQVSEYENIYKNEGSHFFYVGNHKIILSLAKKYLTTPRGKTTILDAGCGTGLLAKKLERFGSTWGIDVSREAVKYTKSRGIKAKLASINKLPFKKNSFDLVVSIDVLYHKQVNDTKALNEFYRVLKPGGIVVVRVPANKWLHLKHDEHVHTRQRYSIFEIKNKISTSGFKLRKISYVNAVLLPLAIAKQFCEKFDNNKGVFSGVGSVNKVVNCILLSFLIVESKIIPYIKLPFGLGIIAVAQKPAGKL